MRISCRSILNVSLILILTGTALPVFSATLNGVTLPGQVSVGGKSLILNGIATREASTFHVKVYVIGLYLEQKNTVASKILASSENKRIEVEFLRKVDAKKVRGAWSEGFKKNTEDLSGITSQINAFNGAMTDMHKGDRMTMDFENKDVRLTINKSKTQVISGTDFQKALLSIWLGKDPANESVTEGLLGK